MSTINTSSSKVQSLTKKALIAAVSVILILFTRASIIPAAPFLEYDMADMPILLGTFLLGPASGIQILVVVSLIQAFFMGGNSIIGAAMHIFATSALLLTAYGVYAAMGRNTRAQIVGLIAGTLAMTAVMIPLNFIFIGLFSDAGLSDVAAMIIPAIIPFNLSKAGINSIIFFPVYKAVGAILARR